MKSNRRADRRGRHCLRIPPLTPILIAASLAIAPEAFAIRDADNQGRWNDPCKDGPDAEVPGFLINMGPTGARGILKERSYVVKYIFRKSPASDLLELDDEVYGANGKRFSEHHFGGGTHGIEGPLQDLGLAIEDSEGGDGILSLMVKRAGKDMKVDIQLEKLGRFADTFPVNCPKTEILKARAYKYLIDHPGGLDSQGRCAEILAMLSSDDSKVFRHGKELAKEWNQPYDEGTWSWHLGFQGIALGEYCLRTGDKSVLRTLKSTSELLRKAQWQAPVRHWKAENFKGTTQEEINKHQDLYDGGFGHAPYTEIVSRGGGGYGPMQWPTCLAIMAWQLAKQCGVEAEEEGIEAAFGFLDRGTNSAGHVAYGGEFTMNNGPVDPERWKAGTGGGYSQKSGLAYIVYNLSPERSDSKKMMKLHLQNLDASYKDMPDGHACAMMGLTWGWAGTFACKDAKLKKKIGDYYKAWINLARCHGSDSYVILPGRDYADLAYYRKNVRNHTTAAVALLYSYSTPKLRIQGVTGTPAKSAGTSRLAPTPAAELRAFRNADQSKTIEGSLVGFDPASGVVRVRLKDGNTRDIPFLSLCKEDQDFVTQQGAAGEEEE